MSKYLPEIRPRELETRRTMSMSLKNNYALFVKWNNCHLPQRGEMKLKEKIMKEVVNCQMPNTHMGYSRKWSLSKADHFREVPKINHLRNVISINY